MTDRIDLDEFDTEEDESMESGNDADWFWKNEGEIPDDSAADRDDEAEITEAAEGQDESDAAQPIPHVPHPDRDKPVGVPVDTGGAGGTPAGQDEMGSENGEQDDRSAERGGQDSGEAGDQEAREHPMEASGPHGGGADAMTMALTYEAAKRLTNPRQVFVDAANWADWLGIVGPVPAHVLNKFQRDHQIDLDFFNGTGTEPGERLAQIDHHSMFFADRMVVVGVEGQDEAIADAAGWEFVPLSDAATKADWKLTE
ncbi:DUF7124 domain-containing protein [Haladaptatus sp. NG-SE-30]